MDRADSRDHTNKLSALSRQLKKLKPESLLGACPKNPIAANGPIRYPTAHEKLSEAIPTVGGGPALAFATERSRIGT
jgi:hypothetical protein